MYELPMFAPPVHTLRTSERASFKRCQMKWWWAFQDGLLPIGPPSPNLWFGIGIHLAFAEWYRPGVDSLGRPNRGVEPQETWAKYCSDEIVAIKELIPKGTDGDEWEKQWHDAQTLGDNMLRHYRETYGEDAHKEYIAPEQGFFVGIPRPGDKYRRAIVNFASTFDGVYRDHEDGLIKLDEHKTAAVISTGHLSLDDQAGSYWMAADIILHDAGLIGPKEYIRGISYNFLRKADPYSDKRPVDAEGYRCNKPQKAHFAIAIAAAQGYPEDHPNRWALEKNYKLDVLRETAEDYGLTVLGDRSAQQPGQFLYREFVERTKRERNTQIRRMGNEALHMEKVRNGELPPTKTPLAFGPTACHHGCDFFAMCELHELGGKDWMEYRDAMYTIHDPYRAYRHLKSA